MNTEIFEVEYDRAPDPEVNRAVYPLYHRLNDGH
jgi:hypothetical protein